ncbi:transposase [Streptomyces sp. RB6PN23]|uniref:Transposase n=1 Tax=Streptomyces silvisoli TaxID=3034235 RepID=A0ABT5ZT58_9ACTN|nr:transposase [Streptomyces silvisoli]MDF3292996.1 transposase [Streptomyces silvisoli]
MTGSRGCPRRDGDLAQSHGSTCVVHLIRASLRFAFRADHTQLVSALKEIYTAPTEQAAEQALEPCSPAEGSGAEGCSVPG